MFRPPREPETDFIKRVIGLPGDRIQVREGILYINGVPVERQRIEDYVNPDAPGKGPVPQYLETLPGGVMHRIIESTATRAARQYAGLCRAGRPLFHDGRQSRRLERQPRVQYRRREVQHRHDRRQQQDCLGKVGFVPKENLIGPAKILFWSYGTSFRWYNPITWVTALRFDRLLNVIE